MEDEVPFHIWLKGLIEDSPMNQTDVAIAVGVQQSAVSMWITGRNRPHKANAKALADVLGVSRKEMFERADIEYRPVDLVVRQPPQAEVEDTFGDRAHAPLDEWHQIGNRLRPAQQRAIIDMLKTFVEP